MPGQLELASPLLDRRDDPVGDGLMNVDLISIRDACGLRIKMACSHGKL
jgi:hypothetical protein